MHHSVELVSNVDYMGGYACVGTEGIWEISVPPSKLYCNLKIALKIVSLSPYIYIQIYICIYIYVSESH